MKPRSLKELTKQHLGLTIQTGEHDPVSTDTNTITDLILIFLMALMMVLTRHSY